MRFGLNDENTNHHGTWLACKAQINSCFERSGTDLCFISLQGDKYGYRPLPKYIDQALFELYLSRCEEDERQELCEWYKLDVNAISPVYVLQTLDKENADVFWCFLSKMRAALEGLAFETAGEYDLLVGNSVTEYEVKHTLALDNQRCIWLRRQFIDARESVDPLFYDGDEGRLVSSKIEVLLEMMEGTIATENMNVNNQLTVKEYKMQAPSSTFNEYMEDWESTTYSLLQSQLEQLTLKQQQWLANGCGIGLSGDEVDEMLHHARLAEQKHCGFRERAELVRHSLQMIEAAFSTTIPVAVAIDEDNNDGEMATKGLFGIALCVIGVSGAGKTALTAKLAFEMHMAHPEVPVIVRFCGTSRSSMDGRSLIISICQQIVLIYRQHQYSSAVAAKNLLNSTTKSPLSSYSYDDAVAFFHDLLVYFPVILFIDSLDQLSDANMARSRLSFLVTRKQYHLRTRIVVSTLPDEQDATTKAWIHCYQCDTRLREANVPRIEVPRFESVERLAEAERIVAELLQIQGRQLSVQQWHIVQAAVEHEPTALYLNLAVKVVSQWTSSSICHLTPTVKGLINQIFDDLEKKYGRCLVRKVLAFLSLSRGGISDNEMQDLLSLCDDVLEEVFQYSKLNDVYRLPMHVWLRLREALDGLIVERSFGCWNWHHRQLLETARARFAENTEEMQDAHCKMGIYFCSIVPDEVRQIRLITTQPLMKDNKEVWFAPNNMINERRCMEGGYHLVRSELHEEAAN